jgi:hypothetical protein
MSIMIIQKDAEKMRIYIYIYIEIAVEATQLHLLLEKGDRFL